jgi:hypothetical protein
MTKECDISVITVNYNGWDDTREFIQSWVRVVTSVSYEIIVVDNASKEDESQTVLSLSSSVRVIRNAGNEGFAIANNIGIKAASGRYLFFLNNDLVIKEDHLRKQLQILEEHPLLAGISPLIRDYAPPYAIQYAGYTALSQITLRNRGIGIGELDASRYPASPTAFLHGAAMLLRRSAIEKVGPMPECYFLYYEELDWSSCFLRQGYQLGYDPTCEVFHKASSATGADSPLKAFYLSRNRLIYAYRHRSGMDRYLSIIYQISLAAVKNSLCCIVRGRPDNAKAIWKGINAYIHINPKKSLL